MQIGSLIKVHIPGEALWAECVKIYEGGTWDGRIDNHPVSHLHAFKFNDVVRFSESVPL